MKVFNVCFKILWRSKIAVLIYLGLFFMLINFYSGNDSQVPDASYSEEKLPIAVIDRDHSKASAFLLDYIGEKQELVEIKDDTTVFQNELYYRNLCNIYIIPKGFETKVINQEEVKIESIEIPNSTYGIYLDIQINQAISILSSCYQQQKDIMQAVNETEKILQVDTPVSLLQGKNQVEEVYRYSYHYQILAYVFLGVIINILGIILDAFNKKEIRMRTICASMSLKQRNKQLLGACSIIALGVWIVFQGVIIAINKGVMLSHKTFGYYLINTFVMMLLAFSVAYLIVTVSKNQQQITLLSNVISLVFSFLGGIFVPLELFGDNVLKICKLIPCYWYTLNNTMLGEVTTLSKEKIQLFYGRIGIILCFVVVLTGCALIASKKRQENA